MICRANIHKDTAQQVVEPWQMMQQGIVEANAFRVHADVTFHICHTALYKSNTQMALDDYSKPGAQGLQVYSSASHVVVLQHQNKLHIVLACMAACICPMSFSRDIVASLMLDDSSVKPNKSTGSNSMRNALHGKYA